MSEATEYEYKQANDELNKVYKQLVDGGLSKENLEELRTAQRLWVQFQDAQADFEADFEGRSGSTRQAPFARWRAQITRARTAELRELLKTHH